MATLYLFDAEGNQLSNGVTLSGSNAGTIEHLGDDHYLITDVNRTRLITFDGETAQVEEVLFVWSNTNTVGGCAAMKNYDEDNAFGNNTSYMGLDKVLFARTISSGGIFSSTYGFLNFEDSEYRSYATSTSFANIFSTMAWDGRSMFLNRYDFFTPANSLITQYQFEPGPDQFFAAESWTVGSLIDDLTYDGSSLWGIDNTFYAQYRLWDDVVPIQFHTHGITGAQGMCYNGKDFVLVGT